MGKKHYVECTGDASFADQVCCTVRRAVGGWTSAPFPRKIADGSGPLAL